MKMVPVAASDHFPFQCRRCGACCHHVSQSVPLEALDAFRLARYLRDRGEPINCIDDVLEKYTEPVLLHKSGYTVFMLRVVGPEDACIFLKDNCCTIHEVNPRACRTYPISVGPDGHGGCEQYLSMEQPQHFHGPQISVKNGCRNDAPARTGSSGRSMLVRQGNWRSCWIEFHRGGKRRPCFYSCCTDIRILTWTRLLSRSSGTTQ